MSSKNVTSEVVSVDEQAFEKADEAEVNEDGFEVVDETPEFQATVQMEVQAKVDANHPDAKVHGLTLEAEEKLKAREWEIERTNKRFDARQQSSREARTRQAALRGSRERRDAFQKRAGCVNRWEHPEETDAREQLSQDELGAVNKQSVRLAEKLDGWSRAAISRRLARKVVEGKSMMSAVVSVYEELQTAAGQVIPIGKIEDVNRKEVSIEGRIEVLWDATSPAIAQVGLIADESGKTKITVWEKSNQPWMEEGERVRIHGTAKNWYNGRVSVALTGWSTVHFPERDRWWEA